VRYTEVSIYDAENVLATQPLRLAYGEIQRAYGFSAELYNENFYFRPITCSYIF
jgi:hypothetical protein